ncbi:hypothetical protein ABS768_08330 [Flavobacterium sp. ST-75]|uniref:Uncharacterized protein n=1 Tax=Flavobacterium rhizophilum TaxID=3163296 RepID=A0ABW8YDU2_9FLAO
MKFLVKIVIFLFLSFLATPTVISLLEDDTDISMVYSLNEEEIHKEIKEIKAGPELEFEMPLIIVEKKSKVINSKYLLRLDNAFGDIFSPPPERV